MDFSGMMGYVGTILGIVGIIVGWVNSKSKNDKANATEVAEIKAEIKELRNDLKGKVDVVLFTEMLGKIDSLTEMVRKLDGDMHSVLNDSNINSNNIAIDQTKIEALEARIKKAENNIDMMKEAIHENTQRII